jgi:hypothetical protein
MGGHDASGGEKFFETQTGQAGDEALYREASVPILLALAGDDCPPGQGGEFGFDAVEDGGRRGDESRPKALRAAGMDSMAVGAAPSLDRYGFVSAFEVAQDKTMSPEPDTPTVRAVMGSRPGKMSALAHEFGDGGRQR